MRKGTLTRAGLAREIFEQLGVSQQLASTLVDRVFEEIAERLADGEVVRIRNFGRFILHRKGMRLGRNPNTQVEAVIKPRRVVSFRSSNNLKRRVNSAPRHK